MDHLDIGDARIAFEDRGDTGPPIFFSHGLLMDRSMFEPQIAELSRQFRCITWDERGHGDSTQRGSWTFWDSARDLLALMDHLEIPRAVLAGMSQGGFLSLRAALLAPDRVRALVMIDSQAGPEPPDLIPVYRGMLERWTEEGGDDVVDAVASVILGPAESSSWKEKWLALDRSWVVEPFNTLVEREDLHDRLSEITCPALVIHGDNDAAIPMEKAESLCSGLPGCEQVVVIAGGGHASNLSHPAQVTTAIRSFLERL
ncbi:MAG: 3-oxoadipate enol-lactonase [Actinomycetota bacterium]|nr:3-oxoadipate enol-lactonase [Actinomycetota bacterium]